MRKQRGFKRVPKLDQRIEFPAQGATYCREEYGVYEYGEYPSSSVLAGQERRSFLASFATLAEAQAAYPNAQRVHGSSYFPERNSVAHLSDSEG